MIRKKELEVIIKNVRLNITTIASEVHYVREAGDSSHIESLKAKITELEEYQKEYMKIKHDGTEEVD